VLTAVLAVIAATVLILAGLAVVEQRAAALAVVGSLGVDEAALGAVQGHDCGVPC